MRGKENKLRPKTATYHVMVGTFSKMARNVKGSATFKGKKRKKKRKKKTKRQWLLLLLILLLELFYEKIGAFWFVNGIPLEEE